MLMTVAGARKCVKETGVVVNRLFDSARDREFGLLVPCQPHRADCDCVRHWQLADCAGFVNAAKWMDLAQKDRENRRLHESKG